MHAKGIAAAENEAKEREAQKARALETAKTSIRKASEKASDALEQLRGNLKESADEIRQCETEAATVLYRQAEDFRDSMAERLQLIADLVTSADNSTVVAEAEGLVQQAIGLAEKNVEEGNLGQQTIRKALDLARQSAAEAAALLQVQAEIRSIEEKARALLQDATSKREDIERHIANALKPDELGFLSEADECVVTAGRFAKKLTATLPIAEASEELDGAQALLKTSRIGLEKIANALRVTLELEERTLSAIRQQETEAQRALTSAQAQTKASAQSALAAAAKANAWLESGRKEAEAFDTDSVKQHLDALRAAVSLVDEMAAETEAATVPASISEVLEDVLAIDTHVQELAAKTLDLAKDAKSALEAVRHSIAALKEERREIEAAQMDAAKSATSAQEAAQACAATFEKLQEDVSSFSLRAMRSQPPLRRSPPG